MLDPANYGSLTITGRSASKVMAGLRSPVTGQAAITINANPGDKINIIGGARWGSLSSTTGILFNAGGGFDRSR